jgi:hypothetical protein
MTPGVRDAAVRSRPPGVAAGIRSWAQSVASPTASAQVDDAGDRWIVHLQRRSSARGLATKGYKTLQKANEPALPDDSER